MARQRNVPNRVAFKARIVALATGAATRKPPVPARQENVVANDRRVLPELTAFPDFYL
jgi:hypothetical protein